MASGAAAAVSAELYPDNSFHNSGATMSLKIQILHAQCDVAGCDNQSLASPESIQLQGWRNRSIHDGQPKLDGPPLPDIFHTGHRTICPDCCKNGYWKELQIPAASQSQAPATKPCDHCSGTGTNKPTGLHSEKCKNCEGSGRVPA